MDIQRLFVKIHGRFPNNLLLCIVPLMLLSPLPVMMAANCASDGLFSTEKSGPAVEFGFFLTGILLTSVFALPVVLMVSGKMAQYSAALSIGGAIAVMASIFLYQVIFNSSSDDE